MGACLSLCGIGNDAHNDEPNERSALLGADALNQRNVIAHPPPPQADPHDIVREQKALSRIVSKTADNLIDIFATNAAGATERIGGGAPSGGVRDLQKSMKQSPFTPKRPKILPDNTITAADKALLEKLVQGAEEAMKVVMLVEDVGPVVVSLDLEGEDGSRGQAYLEDNDQHPLPITEFGTQHTPQPIAMSNPPPHPPNSAPSLLPFSPAKKGMIHVGTAPHTTPIAYEIHGHGPVRIVLLMGFISSMYAWRPQIQYFAHEEGRGEKYIVCILDNRGYGFSGKPWGWYSTAIFARDVMEVLDGLGWVEPKSVHVVGISMGGMISLELAALIPDRIASLCLTSTCAKLIQPVRTRTEAITNWMSILTPKLSHRSQAEHAADSIFPWKWLKDHDPRYPEYKTNRERIVQSMVTRFAYLPKQPTHATLSQGLACLSHNVPTSILSAIAKAIPDIVACTGTDDQLINPMCTDLLIEGFGGEREGVRKVIFEGAGHAVVEERDEEYNKMVEELIKRAENRYERTVE
ncbi:hypothetical protein YB2330_001225 [Saitoella coloradoensis]